MKRVRDDYEPSDADDDAEDEVEENAAEQEEGHEEEYPGRSRMDLRDRLLSFATADPSHWSKQGKLT